MWRWRRTFFLAAEQTKKAKAELNCIERMKKKIIVDGWNEARSHASTTKYIHIHLRWSLIPQNFFFFCASQYNELEVEKTIFSLIFFSLSFGMKSSRNTSKQYLRISIVKKTTEKKLVSVHLDVEDLVGMPLI